MKPFIGEISAWGVRYGVAKIILWVSVEAEGGVGLFFGGGFLFFGEEGEVGLGGGISLVGHW